MTRLIRAPLSPAGQTKTLPVGHVDRLVLAVATCSNYSFGYFNAYEVIANDPAIDLVVHLGDYIYEHGTDGYGGQTGRRIGRNHEPPHETLTLADYRLRRIHLVLCKALAIVGQCQAAPHVSEHLRNNWAELSYLLTRKEYKLVNNVI